MVKAESPGSVVVVKPRKCPECAGVHTVAEDVTGAVAPGVTVVIDAPIVFHGG